MRAIEQGELIADRYLVQGFLGHGIVSIVYLAIDIVEPRTVALKFLRSRFLEMPGLSAPGSSYPMASLLGREIQVHKDLSHPRIVQFLDQGQRDGAPFAVLEYIDCPSLETAFTSPVPPVEAVEIMQQVLDALAYLHDQGVIHRDLKPEHVHYSPESGVKLLDLGLAMRRDDVESTSIVSIMGSKRYGAPEQHRTQGRQSQATERSDVFSAAATFERLLYGPNARMGTGHPLDDELPANLLAILARAMSADPSDRPADARAFRSELMMLELTR